MDTVANEENLSIKGSQRYAVMQKLAQSEEAARVALQKTRTDTSGITPTNVVRIANAVPAGEADETLREEFEEECTRFGRVRQVHIDADESPTGRAFIFVQFHDVSSAQTAVQTLQDRWFGGRQLKAAFYDPALFAAGQYRLGDEAEG